MESPLDYIQRWYHVPVLVVLFGYMLWVRARDYNNFVDGGTVYFSGNDAYYHFRQVSYTVRNWPQTMPYEAWTYYPYGTEVGQFGTLFDQLIATAALIIGLGSPSDNTIAMVTLFAPVVMGALVAIPVFYIGRRLGGRLTGLFGVFVLALIPGSFLRRSLVGFADHHVAEALFMATVILLTMKALSVAEREKPVYEQFLDRDWEGLREPVTWSALLGVVVALYIWTWPPAVIMVAILGAFFVLALSLNFYRGRSPEHVASVGAVSMGAAALLLAVNVDTLGFETTFVSSLQVLFTIGVCAGCVFMGWLAREFNERDVTPVLYPATVFGTIALAAGVVAVVLPTLWGFLLSNVELIFGLGSSDTGRTVAEIQAVPLENATQFMQNQYGLAYVTAFLGWVLLSVKIVMDGKKYRTEHLLLVVWTVVLVLMALTQRRFNYYLVLSVVALNAYVFGRTITLLDVPTDPEQLPDLKGYQVMTLFAIVLVVAAPLIGPLAVTPSAAQIGDANRPGSVTTWADGLDWMEENTPEPGRYGGGNESMSYYGTYGEKNDQKYPDGAYGVMSWWDYGHWITVEGERIPNANPFQQGAVSASTFFQSTNETRAELVLEALPNAPEQSGPLYRMSNDELRQTIDAQNEQEQGEDTRYVVIDDQMAGSKFLPITRWTDDATASYFEGGRYRIGGQNVSLTRTSPKYEETMLSKLYFEDANGLEHYRLVHEVNRYSIVGSTVSGQQVRPRTQLVLNRGWTEPITNRTGAAVPGSDPRNISTQVDRRAARGQVLSLGNGQYLYDAEVESRVKAYERVPGATMTGQLTNTSNATTVAALLTLETDTGRQFTYLQTARTDDQGNFEMTVPYSTSQGLDVDDGYTNESVTAVGNYTFLKGQGSLSFARQLITARGSLPADAGRGAAQVTESAVVKGETVDVGSVAFPASDSGGNGTDGTDGNGTDGTDGNATDGSGTDDGGSDNETTNTTGAVTPLDPVARVAAP